jgi:hypothetical protein
MAIEKALSHPRIKVIMPQRLYQKPVWSKNLKRVKIRRVKP